MVPLQQLLDPLPQGKVISAYSLKKGRSLSRNLLFQASIKMDCSCIGGYGLHNAERP